MTNFEKFMKEVTPEKLAAEMMCPYDGGELPCLENFSLRGKCQKCCLDYLLKEAGE